MAARFRATPPAGLAAGSLESGRWRAWTAAPTARASRSSPTPTCRTGSPLRPAVARRRWIRRAGRGRRVRGLRDGRRGRGRGRAAPARRAASRSWSRTTWPTATSRGSPRSSPASAPTRRVPTSEQPPPAAPLRRAGRPPGRPVQQVRVQRAVRAAAVGRLLRPEGTRYGGPPRLPDSPFAPYPAGDQREPDDRRERAGERAGAGAPAALASRTRWARRLGRLGAGARAVFPAGPGPALRRSSSR